MASKLINLSPHEAQIQLEVSLREAYCVNQPKLTPPLKYIIPSPEEYLSINRAIVYGVLCEPTLANIHIKYLHALVNDGYCFFIKLLVQIIDGLYSKLLEFPKVQLIWVASVMIDVSGVGFDNLVVSLLRQIVSGDCSDGNLWLSYEMVNLLFSKWDLILDAEPVVLGYGLYTYLRLLADHYCLARSPRSTELKHKEIRFCVRLLREQFHLCLRIGRDLIRLLQDLAHIPEFRAIWKDLLVKPSSFGVPIFSDISLIYGTRTSSRYFLLRITPEMESQLRFLLTHVKLGTQRRHQAWFARKFLFRPERETLISDIVRFICGAHHPSNELLQSEVIPRWAVIGWLLTSCSKKYVEASVKLTLFYDWLFFDEKVDNFMNVEPAMLLMVNSIPKYVDMTNSLLEFLLLLVDNYDMDRKDVILKGVSSAINLLVRKGVIASLNVLAYCNFLPPSVKKNLQNFMLRVESGVVLEPQIHEMPSFKPSSSPSSNTSFMEIQKHVPEVPPANPTDAEVTTQQNLASDFIDSGDPLSGNNIEPVEDVPKVPPACPFNAEVTTQQNLASDFIDSGDPLGGNNAESVKDVPKVSPARPMNAEVTTQQNLVSDSIDSGDSLGGNNAESVEDVGYLIGKIGDSMKSSNKMGQQIVEKILLLCNCGSSEKPTDTSSEILACQIRRELEMVGYKLFSRFGDDVDDEVQSVTATVIRVFIFTQHQRIREMMCWWSKNGCLVGARLLSYAVRLSYEANQGGYGACFTDEIIKVLPLLKFHIEGSSAFISQNEEDTTGTTSSNFNIDKKVTPKMIDDAYTAYRSIMFPNSSTALSNNIDLSSGKLLSFHAESSSAWKHKKYKFVLHDIFLYLSDLSLGDEDLIQLLICQLGDADVLSMQIDLRLKRYAIFGEDVQNVLQLIKSSLNWKKVYQFKFWELAISELIISGFPVEKLLLYIFFSDDFDPKATGIAFDGLMKLCNCHAPTPEIVSAVMLLPNNKFPDFAAAVLSHWAYINQAMLSNSFADFLNKFENKNGDASFDCDDLVINQTAVLFLLNYLEAQGGPGNNMLGKSGLNLSDVKTRLANSAAAMDTG